jgi:dTDP-4-dehydrorhamnose 3,5-epimerase
VLVDMRRGSPTYAGWEAYELSDDNGRILYAPIGFGHGFCVISDVADVFYKQSNYYSDDVERGIAYADPDVGIEWPLPTAELLVSERDRTAPLLREVAGALPFEYAAAAR